MLATWLLLGVLTSAASEPTSAPGLATGADIQAWRDLGDSPTLEQLQSFLESHQASPLAELAVRRLEKEGVSLPVQGIGDILDSLLAHEARLSQSPVVVVAAPLEVTPLHPEEIPRLQRPAVASVED